MTLSALAKTRCAGPACSRCQSYHSAESGLPTCIQLSCAATSSAAAAHPALLSGLQPGQLLWPGLLLHIRLDPVPSTRKVVKQQGCQWSLWCSTSSKLCAATLSSKVHPLRVLNFPLPCRLSGQVVADCLEAGEQATHQEEWGGPTPGKVPFLWEDWTHGLGVSSQTCRLLWHSRHASAGQG